MSSLLMFLGQFPPEVQGFLVVLDLLMQLAAVVHVVVTGRRFYWFWVILGLPVGGPLLYFALEVVPYRTFMLPANPLQWLLDRLISGRELARLQDHLERSNSVANRIALAEYHVRQKAYNDALPLYECSLAGAYRDDAGMMIDFAQVHFLAGHNEDARLLLERARATSPSHEAQKRDFLLGRVAEESGDRVTAFETYERMRTSGPITEEARVRLALLLEDRGDRQRAKELYTDVVRRMRSANNVYRREQKPWLLMARQRLKQLESEAAAA